MATEIDVISTLGTNIQCMSETNKPWTEGNKWEYDFMVNAVFQNAKTVYSSARPDHRYQYMPGGNLLSINGSEAGRIKSTGSDDWGRFCWATLRGKRDEGVIFITAYRVCHESHDRPGVFTAY